MDWLGGGKAGMETGDFFGFLPSGCTAKAIGVTKSLAVISKAKRALAAARSLDEVLNVRDQAEAVRVYIKAAGDGLEMQNSATEIKLIAERRAGEMLA